MEIKNSNDFHFLIQNCIFTMKSASFNIAILSSFSQYGLYFHHTKSAQNETDFNLFLNIRCKCHISVIRLVYAQNMGHKPLKTCSKYNLMVFLNEKELSTFATWINSAMIYNMVMQSAISDSIQDASPRVEQENSLEHG